MCSDYLAGAGEANLVRVLRNSKPLQYHRYLVTVVISTSWVAITP